MPAETMQTKVVRAYLKIGFEQEVGKALAGIDRADLVSVTMSKGGPFAFYQALIVYTA